ncbi:MAG TPA: metal-dependent hydrolase [Azospira sp.]|nr:metal-dependent hydrolase [Azospira sp.]
MDSVSQIALGASVALAVMGRRTAPWKSAAVGGALGTLPDLDVVVDYGDAVLDMVLHRADSHSLFYLSLLGPLLGLAAARLSGDWHRPELRRRWALAAWLALFTHPLLDLMTVYGTQLLRPFSSHPFGLGSVFIIDPLYTVPLLVGIVWTLRSGRLRANLVGLALATAYLGWGAAVQQHVTAVARESLRAQGIAAERLLVTPTAFNSVLWRVVAVTPTDFYEGFHGLLDAAPAAGAPAIRFERFSRGAEVIARWQGHWAVPRIAAFSHGFYKMREEKKEGGRVWLTDLRMGQEPFYSFDFDLAAADAEPAAVVADPAPVGRVGRRVPLDRGLPWLGRRLLGEPLPPPR